MNDNDQEMAQRAAQTRMTLAMEDFRRARWRAALHAVAARLRGEPVDLLSYQEVSQALQVAGQVERGVREIPVAQIIGSVGRYQDFDSSFLPRKSHDAQRWAGLLARVPDLTTLPPIEVYQIGDAYFVSDGNHRVSLAHHVGAEFIAAQVTEVHTRAPLPEDRDPLALVLAAEYADFLAFTRLDRLRPEADLRLSVPGGYTKLENLIEVGRFFTEMAEERPLSDSEAVTRWYDESYQPVLEVIREHGLLRGFPQRTEADLYLWIAENQAALRNELGWQASPQSAAAGLQPDDVHGGLLARLRARVKQQVRLTAVPAPAAQSWSAQKLLDRYSQVLFGEILVLLGGPDEEAALAQALWLARAEGALLHGLLPAEASEAAEAGEQFAAFLADVGLRGELTAVAGDPVEGLRRRTPLVDLLVLGPGLGAELVDALLQSYVRPLLFAAAPARPLGRVLLALDDGAQTNEALFVAAYMAEAWGAALALLVDPALPAAALDEARRYLALHERDVLAETRGPLSAAAAEAAAAQHGCDLIVWPGSAAAFLQPGKAERPWLICP